MCRTRDANQRNRIRHEMMTYPWELSGKAKLKKAEEGKDLIRKPEEELKPLAQGTTTTPNLYRTDC